MASAGPAVDPPERGRHRGAGRRAARSSRCAGASCGPRTSAWSAPSRPRRPSCSTTSGSAGPPPRRRRSPRPTRCATALLAAVGHDFRTPLAAAKAAVSTPAQRRPRPRRRRPQELLQAADTSLDRLAALVDNLLDMSRLQAGAMSIDVQPTAVDEVIARALDDLGGDGRRIVIDAAPGRAPACWPTPGCWSGWWRTSCANALRYSPRRPAAAPDQQPARRPGRDPGHRPRARDPRRPSGTASSCPSNASATPTTPPASASGSPSPAGSPRPWAGPSSPRRPPAAALTMVDLAAHGRRPRGGRARPARAGRGRDVTRVLVVDDEPPLLRALAINLRARHYEVARRRLRGRGPHRRGRPPSRPGHPRPRPARHGRHRGHRRACAAGPTSPSWCCRDGPTAWTRSRPSTPAPTTT